MSTDFLMKITTIKNHHTRKSLHQAEKTRGYRKNVHDFVLCFNKEIWDVIGGWALKIEMNGECCAGKIDVAHDYMSGQSGRFWILGYLTYFYLISKTISINKLTPFSKKKKKKVNPNSLFVTCHPIKLSPNNYCSDYTYTVC